MTQLNKLTIKKAKEGLKEKKFTPKEIVKDCLLQMKKVDKKIKALVTINEKKALQQAEKITKKDLEKPLGGIPIVLKDNFCTKGVKTTASAKVLENYIPPYSATVVKKLEQAGAIILGKTNMDAWAHGSSTETSDFFTTKNPWDLSRVPGGSSGGSAAAVVSDQIIAATGTETAGSIRQPASWCGCVGLKPTYGRVSRYGIIAMCSSTDSPGPITKTVEDAALMLRIMAGHDPKDATSSEKKVNHYLSKPLEGLKNITIGLPKEYFMDKIDSEVIESTQEVIKQLKTAGAKFKRVSLLDPKYSIAVYTIAQRAEVSSNLARLDGIRYGKDRSNFGDEAKRRMMLGAYVLSKNICPDSYIKAQKARRLLASDFEKVFSKVDLVLAPSTPVAALKIGESEKNPMFGEMMDVLFEASSLVGLPGLSFPSGFSKNGLPLGTQIMGPHFSEDLILKVGYHYQTLTDWHKKRPEITKDKDE